MTFDISRSSFQPGKDYFGVVMQQGKVQLDSDWNEWVAELSRRLHVGTMDAMGRAVVPRNTPNAFHIFMTAGELTIGPGRAYVDGLLAENHGAKVSEWSSALGELVSPGYEAPKDPANPPPAGAGYIAFKAQPYLPFNANAVPDADPAHIYNAPTLSAGSHLVYLDVWQRDVSYVQDDNLIEKAVGIDTTGRRQAVWQVRVLPDIGNNQTCESMAQDKQWNAATQPSAGRLTTSSGPPVDAPNPCLPPPEASYKGLENHLYRIEIHQGGGIGTATFKWSRDNATVASRVTSIHDGGKRLVVESLGRDEFLSFRPNDWIEIIDDWLELHGQPGELRRIKPNGGIDSATHSIILDDAITSALFPTDAQGNVVESRNTRVRRWDQAADGPATQSNGIKVPAGGTKAVLESGIYAEFTLEPSTGIFKTGDYWLVAARVSDGSVEILTKAPPRGIHHHFAHLAIVAPPDGETDCRVLWPQAAGESCACTICVSVKEQEQDPNAIQRAIDKLAKTGGTICLEVGVYGLRGPLKIQRARALRIRGQGTATVLQASGDHEAFAISEGRGLTIENLSMIGPKGAQRLMLDIANTSDVTLSSLAIHPPFGSENEWLGSIGTAIRWSGIAASATICDCTLSADEGIVFAGTENGLLAANLEIGGNQISCTQRGINFTGRWLQYGMLSIVRNGITGCKQAAIRVPGSIWDAGGVAISDNFIRVQGHGIEACIDNLRISDNDIVPLPNHDDLATGIRVVPGEEIREIDRVHITGNRIVGLFGIGIHIAVNRIDHAMIKSNIVQGTRGPALVLDPEVRAGYLCVENNQFIDLFPESGESDISCVGVRMRNADRIDVIGNLFDRIAQKTKAQYVTAFFAYQCTDLRIAANRIFGVGPADPVAVATGISIGYGFDLLAIDDNNIQRTVGPDTKANATWQAIRVNSEAKVDLHLLEKGTMLLPLARDGLLFLSPVHVAVQRAPQRQAGVRRNSLRGNSLIPLAEVAGVTSCFFDQNDGECVSEKMPPVATIRAAQISASSNRLLGSNRDASAFGLQTDPAHLAVLANITNGPITVNNAPIGNPWAPLNVRV